MTAPLDALEIPKAWLEYAQGDLAAAEGGIVVQTIPGWIIGFHVQQATEKAFKGAMALAGLEPPRTHDLLRLDAILGQAGIAGPLSGEELVSLSRFAVEDRYPVLDAPRVARHEAGELVPLAARAVTWLVQRVQARGEPIHEQVHRLVNATIASLPEHLAAWALAHLITPRPVQLASDPEGHDEATYWLVTDHSGIEDSSYRVVYDAELGEFGLECTWEGGTGWFMGIYGSFADSIENM